MRHGTLATGALRAWLDPSAARTGPRTAEAWLLGAAGSLCVAALAVGYGVGSGGPGIEGTYRIVLVHVPATWVALVLYALFAGGASLGWIKRSDAASMLAEAIAPTGALFALLSLWTGSLWSRAVHDLWWDWDARRVAGATLLAVFVACVLLREAIDDVQVCDRVSAVLALAGIGVALVVLRPVDVMPRALSRPGESLLGPKLALALAAMTAALLSYAAAAVLKRLRCVLLEHRRAREAAAARSAWR